MTATLLFCTSTNITAQVSHVTRCGELCGYRSEACRTDAASQHVYTLNETYRQSETRAIGETILYNNLNPAHLDPSAVLKPSKTPVNAYEITAFEDASDDRLRELSKEIMQKALSRGIRSICGMPFAVLDDRGVKDQTVVFHGQHLNFDDELDETRYWRSWRVKWEDAYDMDMNLRMTVEIVDRVFTQSDRFLDQEGVFHVRTALKEFGYILEV